MVVSKASGTVVTALKRHTHATHVIYVTLTIKLGPAPLCDLYTRVRFTILRFVIAVPAPKHHTPVTHVN